jgi:hypothetical protein
VALGTSAHDAARDSHLPHRLALRRGCCAGRRAPRPRRTPLDVPIALFVVAGAIGIFVAPDHRCAVGIYRAYLVEPLAPYRADDPYLVPEPYPHDISLSSWTELGLLGVAAFTWILGWLLIAPWRAYRRTHSLQRPLLWGLGAAFTMLLVHGLVDTLYWKDDLSLEFWILAAISVVSVQAVHGSSPGR